MLSVEVTLIHIVFSKNVALIGMFSKLRQQLLMIDSCFGLFHGRVIPPTVLVHLLDPFESLTKPVCTFLPRLHEILIIQAMILVEWFDSWDDGDVASFDLF